MNKLNKNTALRGFIPMARMRGNNVALRRIGKTERDRRPR